MWQTITEKDKEKFNQLATHPLQSYEWGEFREKTGIKVIRKGFFEKNKLKETFQLTIHPIPHTPWNIGYLPKATLPTKEMLTELSQIGKEEKCIFIQLEPNIVASNEARSTNQENIEHFKTVIRNSKFIIRPSAHPLFTKYTLQIDLTKSEEELLQAMHSKARYNIKVAKKHGVIVEEENTHQAFEQYWNLTQETTSRQQFFAHSKKYHEMMWDTLKPVIASVAKQSNPKNKIAASPSASRNDDNQLSAYLLVAKYQGQILTAWIVFVFKDTLYYPYGASSQQHRETMHSTLMMWEAIRFGKKHHLKTFDLWGAAKPGTPESDPWFGFTQFKERFGPERVEFIGSYDLIINPVLYQGYKLADKLRWLLMRFK